MTELFHTELKNDHQEFNPKLKLAIAITGLIALISLKLELLLIVIGTLVCILIIIISIFQIGRKRIIRLTPTHLYNDTYIFGQYFSDAFEISKIDKLIFRKCVKSDLKISVRGEPKKYYIHPEVLQFSYENRTISIGKHKESFNCQKLFDLITELQNE